MINNTPEIKLGIVAVSRDCFPNSLSENRRKAVVKAYDGEIYECPIIVENEIDMMNALEDLKKAECDALVVYLGNFGPEDVYKRQKDNDRTECARKTVPAGASADLF